ncbi:TIGR03546 family protein [Treponema sp. UBA3813]|uniref:TIGR03546 family protein n=1 Tax=Treponema sp. UBA3813 TaxID=1947715 RepID=UPI0025DCA140|nr:TIGR03546 family protein [Treponema sp. UBA3813]
MIKSIVNLFKALNANVNPGEIAHAFSCGILLGLMPKDNLLWWLLFVFILFIRINKPMYVIMILIGATFSPVMDALFDTVGYSFLTIPAFSGLFGTLLEIPFVGFTKFNNSVVAGSFLCGIVLYVPLYFLGRLFVSLWRKHIAAAIRHSKLAKLISNLPVLSKIAGMVGGE